MNPTYLLERLIMDIVNTLWTVFAMTIFAMMFVIPVIKNPHPYDPTERTRVQERTTRPSKAPRHKK
jgi:hypothetical protein